MPKQTDHSLNERNRQEMAKRWVTLAEKIPSARRKAFQQAAEAINANSLSLVKGALSALSLQLFNINRQYDASEAMWQLARWGREVDNCPESEQIIYDTASTIITLAENAPADIREKAQHCLLDILPEMLAPENPNRILNAGTLLDIYDQNILSDEFRPNLEEQLLDLLNDLEEKQRNVDIDTSVKEKKIFVKIIDVCMLKTWSSPLLQRARELRKSEILEKLANDPAKKSIFGHAENILRELDM